MATRILDLSERHIWNRYLSRIERKDIYFTPEYCEIYERNGEGKAQLFVYEEGENFVYYPFLLRNLNELSYLSKSVAKHGTLYDITTPYGYGGPITNTNDENVARALLFQFLNCI